jgi:uncharacterized protein (DUF1499 family)
MSFWLWVLIVVCLAVAAPVAAFLALGPERLWTLFGPADLGPVDFAALDRRATPTDALASPPEVTPADADILPPVYPVDVAALRKALHRALASERRLTLIDIDDKTPADRYIQRSERMRFPDTIIVRYVPVGESRSTVAIYSRSQLGRSDLGINLTRIERWLDKLTREVARLRKAP